MSFMLREFFRSFKGSLLKNILLMMLFTISVIISVIMFTYYTDVKERDSDIIQESDNGVWYPLEFTGRNDDHEEVFNTLSTAKGCRNLVDYGQSLRNMEDWPVYTFFTQQNMWTKENDFRTLIGDNDYHRFLPKYRQESFSAYIGEETCLLFDLKCAQTDVRGYRMFGLRTGEGVGFTEENTTLNQASDEVPIILGNEYKGIISVGQTMDLYFDDEPYKCKVIGILEQNTQLPRDGNSNNEMISLDSYIIFPYGIRFSGKTTKTNEIHKFAYLEYWALGNASVRVDDEKKLKQLVLALRDKGEEFGLPPLQVVGTSMGLDLLRKEAATGIRILLILTIALICFTFYALFVTFFDKIQSNTRVYGIYLMNGCSLKMIVLPFLLEMAIILFPAILIGRYIFGLMGVEPIILYIVYCFAGLAFLIGSGFIIYLMKGVDTEHLIRQKE